MHETHQIAKSGVGPRRPQNLDGRALIERNTAGTAIFQTWCRRSSHAHGLRLTVQCARKSLGKSPRICTNCGVCQAALGTPPWRNWPPSPNVGSELQNYCTDHNAFIQRKLQKLENFSRLIIFLLTINNNAICCFSYSYGMSIQCTSIKLFSFPSKNKKDQ